MLAAIASIRRVSPYLPRQPNGCHTMHWFSHMLTTALWYGSLAPSASTKAFHERVQNLARQVILSKSLITPSALLRNQLRWSTLHKRRHSSMLCQVHRCVCSNKLPVLIYVSGKFVKNSCTYSSTRGVNKVHLPQPRTHRDIEVIFWIPRCSGMQSTITDQLMYLRLYILSNSLVQVHAWTRCSIYNKRHTCSKIIWWLWATSYCDLSSCSCGELN